MPDERFIGCKLHHLGVHHHQFQLRRVFLVQQRSDDGIDGYRLTGTRCTGHQQVGRLGQVEHKDLVGDGSSVGDRQTHLLLLLETLGGDDGVHRDDLRLLVGHFDTDSALAGNGGNDTNAHRRERQHDIVLQRLNLRHTHTRLWHNFIERDRRTHRSLNRLNLNAVVPQGGYNTIGIRLLFGLINDWCGLVVIDLQ